MRFTITTPVSGSVPEVFALFGPDLLLKLSPPLMHVTIREMDYPVKLNGAVRINVKIMGLISQNWHNKITEIQVNDRKSFFVDEGVILPGMFRQWRHCHIIQQNAEGNTEIVDDIEYHSANGLFTVLLFPLVYLQFLYRKPVYRKYFRAKFA